MSVKDSIHILGQKKEEQPMALQLADAVANAKLGEIYLRFAYLVMNELIDEIKSFTGEEESVIRDRNRIKAENNAKTRVLAKGGNKNG
jgi:hypothetical protein